MWTRCLPAVRTAQEVAAVRLGPVSFLRADLARSVRYDPGSRLWDPATGGGVCLDMGVYVAHLAWAFLGEPEALAVSGRRAPNGVDSTVAMQWSYPDGSTAQLAASFESTAPDPHFVIAGEDGWLAWWGRTHEPAQVVLHVGDSEEIVAVGNNDGFAPEVAEVERAVRDGDLQSPLVPLTDTVGVLRVLDAARAELGVDYGELEEL
jgi:predicted dehydrogenase